MDELLSELRRTLCKHCNGTIILWQRDADQTTFWTHRVTGETACANRWKAEPRDY